MKKFCLFLLFLSSLLTSSLLHAQQYSGMTGLISVPSAEMGNPGDARIGSHFLNKVATPDALTVNGHKYNTFDFYLALTPFWWVEGAFVITLAKANAGVNANPDKFQFKDRYFTVKINPLREGKYYPAVAVGYQDIFSSGKMCYFGNYYLALTKNFDFRDNRIGATLVYRKYSQAFNQKWNGLVGGVTFSPSFAKNWRAILEWNGDNVNIGIDTMLWNHLLVQFSLQDGKYPSAGLCYKVNLF